MRELLTFRVLLVLFCAFDVFEASLPGIYLDNGLDQTVIDRSMSGDEKREMELEILNLLGLPKRPRRISNPPLKRSAPRFLMDVYKSLMEDENARSKRSVDLNLSGEEQNAIDNSDVIMTFESLRDRVPGVRHERGRRLWFNVSEVPVAESIVGAELRIFQNSTGFPIKADRKFSVTIYELVRIAKTGERELEYVTSVNTTAVNAGWLSLNLTKSLANWVAFPDSNKGLYLSVHPSHRPGHEIHPDDIGVVTLKEEDDETQPFLVAFLKATNHVQPSRQRRDVSKRSRTEFTSVLKHTSNQGSSGQDWRSCRIQTLYISFKDLKWQDWIIAPDGYAAYYCFGECSFPLNKNMNATNHAIVQTLVHLMKPLTYPKPCCAPTKLTPISVLYFVDDTNVVLKRYKKMVVKSCGCH